MDPGFLPYNWIETRKSKYLWQEQLNGLAILKEQFDFALNNPRPIEASFSHSSGRFIIRGDHICGWISNWVGKRNHKQFFLLMFWGSFFVYSLAFPRLLPGPSLENCTNDLIYSLANLASIIEIIIATLLLCGFISEILEIKQNVTKIQKWKNIKSDTDNGFEEVFGKTSKLMWFIPTPAFNEIELTIT